MKYLLFLFLFIFSSCSFKSLFISKADYLITKKLSSELMLNDKQETLLRKDIVTILNEQKIFIKKDLEVIEKINLEELKKENLQVLTHAYNRTAKKIIPILSKYINLLDSKQRVDFFKSEESKNQDIEKEIRDINTRSIEKKYKRLLDYINDRQKKLIKENFQFLKQLSIDRLNRRLLIQKKLKASRNSKEIDQALAIYTEYLDKKDDQKERSFNFFFQLLTLSNKDQIKTIENKRAELVEILKIYLKEQFKFDS